MTAPLIAANRIQTDMAGLTGAAAPRSSGAAASLTETLSSLVHGESGSLGYLFDNAATIPVGDPLRAPAPTGPNGGAAHPDAAGQRAFAPTIGAGQRIGPTNRPLPVPVAEAPGPGIADQARSVIGGAQEAVRGIFGG